MDGLEIVELFARALGEGDYLRAGSLLSDECVYRDPERQVVGTGAVLDRYRAASNWARRTFERVHTERSVEPVGDAFAIHFTDRLEHRGESLVHRSEDIVRLNDRGSVAEIDHNESPGQADAVARFLEKIGVRRR